VDDLAEACGKFERDEKYMLGSGLKTEKKEIT